MRPYNEFDIKQMIRDELNIYHVVSEDSVNNIYNSISNIIEKLTDSVLDKEMTTNEYIEHVDITCTSATILYLFDV